MTAGASSPDGVLPAASLEAHEPRHGFWRYSPVPLQRLLAAAGLYAPLGRDARYVFYALLKSHHFMHRAFGNLPGARLLFRLIDPWNPDEPARAAIRESLRDLVACSVSRPRAVFVYTLDYFLQPDLVEDFVAAMARIRARRFALLHRPPSSDESVANLRRVAKTMSAIFVAIQEMVENVQALGISNVTYLPHHAPMFDLGIASRDREALRRRAGVRPHQTVFSVVGEQRPGKGLDLALGGLAAIAPTERSRLFVLLAGTSDPAWARYATSELAALGIAHHLDLRDGTEPGMPTGLTREEYADYTALTDAGLLLYCRDQRRAGSGTFAELVWARRRVLTLADSAIGRLAVRHGLGLAAADERPETIADVILSACAAGWTPESLPPAFIAYRASIAPASVLACLQRHLDGRAA